MEGFLDRPSVWSESLPQRPRAARRAVAMIFFVNGALFATWVSRIPVIQARLSLSYATLGVALFGFALGALVAMPVAGWCSSRFGSHRVTQFTTLLYCATVPWLAFAPNAALLGLALFCFGALHGALDVAMNAQAVAVEERYREPIMSSFHALFSLGGLVGAALGGVVATAGVAPRAHFLVAALFLGCITAVLALPRLLDAGEVQLHELVSNLTERRRFCWPPRTLLALGALAFFIMMGEGAMGDWSAIFLRHAGATEGVAAAGYAAFSIAMAAARFSGDGLSARLGPVTLVRAGSALAAAGLAMALLFGQPAAALIGFVAVGAGFATIVPQVFSAAGRTAGMAAGPALATATTLGYLGFLVGPPLIGFAAEAIGLRVALGIVVVTSVIAIVLAPSVRSAPAHGC